MKKGHFIFPRGVIRVVQGTVRALFYTEFFISHGTIPCAMKDNKLWYLCPSKPLIINHD
jgi:hypothetical protein